MLEESQNNNNNQSDLPNHLVPQKSNNKRIAKNAFMLYIRMFLTMIVGLYTSRVVLATLGVEDYGIYGVVGGVVAMMGFLNASMSGATSRFLTFELGRGDKKRLEETFSSSLIVHLGIALIVFVIAETIGLWFLCNKLVIPEDRMGAAHWVYQCSILSAILSITQVPYNASIIAHEKMDVYAYVEILNVTLKLLIVYLLIIGNYDKLILYAFLHLAVVVVILIIYRIYCIRNFKETHFHWIWNKSILKPLLTFSGWDLYGNGCVTIRQQGTNFLINMFFGVVYNAASSIATTAQGVVTSFATVVIYAFKPQIIKNYAKNDIARMQILSGNAIKFVVILFGCIAIPLIYEMPYVMELWLGEVPEKAVVFCRLLLLFMFFALANNVLITCIHATGNIRRISIITGSIHLLILPVIYIAFLAGLKIESAYIIILLSGFFIDASNLYIIKRQIPEMNILFLVRSWCYGVLVTAAVSIITIFILISLGSSFLRLAIIVITQVLLSCVITYTVILSSSQKKEIISIIKKKIKL